MCTSGDNYRSGAWGRLVRVNRRTDILSSLFTVSTLSEVAQPTGRPRSAYLQACSCRDLVQQKPFTSQHKTQGQGAFTADKAVSILHCSILILNLGCLLLRSEHWKNNRHLPGLKQHLSSQWMRAKVSIMKVLRNHTSSNCKGKRNETDFFGYLLTFCCSIILRISPRTQAGRAVNNFRLLPHVFVTCNNLSVLLPHNSCLEKYQC